MLIGNTLIFTDIHFGIHGNSDKYLELCINTMKWITLLCEQQHISNVIFMGDFFDSRSSIDIKTMNYASECLNELSLEVSNVYMILGNHDLYLRDATTIHSLAAYKMCDNITIVNKPIYIEDCALIPWGYCKDNDKETIIPNDIKYVFMHHDFPRSFFFENNVAKNNLNDTTINDRYGYLGISRDAVNTIIKNEGIIFSGHIHIPRTIPLTEKSFVNILGSPYETEFGFSNAKCGVVIWSDNKFNFIENPYNKKHIEITTSTFNDDFNNIEFENSFIRLKVDSSESFDTVSKIQHTILSKNPYFMFNTIFDFKTCPFTGKREETENPTNSLINQHKTKLDHIYDIIDNSNFSEFNYTKNNEQYNIDKNIVKELAKQYFEKIGIE